MKLFNNSTSHWVLRHVFKEQNQMVDCMAKEGARLGHFGDLKSFMTPQTWCKINYI